MLMISSGHLAWSGMVKRWALLAALVWLQDWVLAGPGYIRCGECEVARCPELHYCEGQAIKDHCGCCTVCSSSKFQPHIMIEQQAEGNACDKVKCPKLKVCVVNMQGLPLCTCPNPYVCRGIKKREVCGTDGHTYQSRCHMRVASCHEGVLVRKKHKGLCTEPPTTQEKQSVKKTQKRRRRRKPEGGDTTEKFSKKGKKLPDSVTPINQRNKQRKGDKTNGEVPHEITSHQKKPGSKKAAGKASLRKQKKMEDQAVFDGDSPKKSKKETKKNRRKGEKKQRKRTDRRQRGRPNQTFEQSFSEYTRNEA